MRRLSTSLLSLAAGTSVLACLSGTALAQAAGSASAGAVAQGDDAGLSDIIVTAQRRSESARTVPIAISAFNSDTIKQAAILDVLDLQRVAPSLRIDLGTRSNVVRLSIRGVGSSGGTAVEPSVATFVDGAYLPREGMARTAFFDLDSIEVLRGPQGTLFGRNASVGAISLNSAKPTVDFSGKISGEYGTGERKKLDGFVNIPVAPNLNMRIAGTGEIFEGFYFNRLNGKRVGGANTYATRGTLDWSNGNGITNTLRISYAYREGNDLITPYEVLPNSFPAGTQATYTAHYASIGSTVDLDPFDFIVNEYSGDILSDKQFGLVNTLAVDVGSGFQTKLISSYHDWRSRQDSTSVMTAQTPTLFQHSGLFSKSHSEELQILSPGDLLSDHLSFIAGAYYFYEKLRYHEDLIFTEDLCNLALTGNPLYSSCIASAGNLIGENNFNQTTESLAAYGQATIKIVPTLSLSLGARYTHDKKDGRSLTNRYALAGAIFFTNEDTALRINKGRLTYRANLTWKPTSSIMAFATYSTGFKSGGFNSTDNGNAALGQLRVLKPETVESYEAGVKTNWLDRRLQFDAVIYQMNIKNFQDRSFNGNSFSVVNAGDIRNRGVEIDAAVRPIPNLRMNASVAYLDSKFTSYPMGSNLIGLPGTQNLTGTRPTFTPEWSGTVGAELDGDLGSSGLSWLLHGDVSFNSSMNINATNNNDPRSVQGGYALFGARFTIYGPDKAWSAAIFGQNLSDHHYCTGNTSQPFGGPLGVVANGQTLFRCNSVAPPRTLGAALSINF